MVAPEASIAVNLDSLTVLPMLQQLTHSCDDVVLLAKDPWQLANANYQIGMTKTRLKASIILNASALEVCNCSCMFILIESHVC